MTILITGVSGLIGSHLCKKLVGDGHQVVGLINKTVNPTLITATKDNNLMLRSCDIRDRSVVSQIIRDERISIVFHLAACLPHTPVKDFVGINVIGTANLLNAARSNGVDKFVYASSMSVYSSPPNYIPVDENHPTCPVEHYGLSKLVGEKLCLVRQDTLNTVIIRYASVFGVGGDSRVVSNFMQASLLKKPVQVDGNGQQGSDFIYVDDAVEGTLLAWKKGKSGNIYNIGSDKETTIMELAQSIASLAEPKSKVLPSHCPATRPFRFVANINKARSELGYNPMSLERGLRIYWRELHDTR